MRLIMPPLLLNRKCDSEKEDAYCGERYWYFFFKDEEEKQAAVKLSQLMATSFDLPEHTSIVNNCRSINAGDKVSRVIISGSPISTVEAPDITYHYRIFLVVQRKAGSPDHSIRLDMQPDTSKKNIGILTLDYLGYEVSKNPRAINFTATVSEGATVATFVNHWIKLKRNQYQCVCLLVAIIYGRQSYIWQGSMNLRRVVVFGAKPFLVTPKLRV